MSTLSRARAEVQANRTIYLPHIERFQMMPFGAETSSGWIAQKTVNQYARELGIQWWRRSRVSWRQVQPTRGAAYNASSLATLDSDLQAALAAKFTPIVIVHDSPAWATINDPFPTSCGAIRADRFGDFAAFMGWLAERYKYRVRYWEIGNEPDVDPRNVVPDEVYGCWGDSNDPYYGGEHYGRMLNAVTPAVRRANPAAQVVIGGLALEYPSSAATGGESADFLEGILRAGAANSFDIVAYHSYPGYSNQPLDYDYDIDPDSDWSKLGGYAIGKARFLRSVMERYGVDKPLALNETALICSTPPDGVCPGADAIFLQAQADYMVRMMTRAWSVKVEQIVWYTLQGPGWRESGLLDDQQRPRPVYRAYRQFVLMTDKSDPPALTTAYDRSDVSVEAYRFSKGMLLVDLVWSKNLSTYYVEVPPHFIKAYDQYGAEVKQIGPYLPVGFSPIYIQHTREHENRGV
jgi:hypothetical protein